MAKQQKQVQVLATYHHKTNGKLNGRVSYLVRSSNGKDTYCTTVINGKASGCSCPSHKPCYHMTQLESREVARTSATTETVDEKTVQVSKEVSQAQRDQETLTRLLKAQNVDHGTYGHLHSARAFSILR